ncbi:MAG: hypothetical protein NC338_04210 [Firmicutes bacterium]|nr:hypothetical protein [Bacillota bacterium]MCM1400789.1 hypothetical protein [Bacteroides sp.]MCM1476710.1 hypothetical protein [Bacteroides sp.]
MKLKYIIPAFALTLCATAFADTNKMIVLKTDGEKTTYDVGDVKQGTFTNDALEVNGQKVADIADIANVSFVDVSTLPFTIVDSKGEYVVAEQAVPTMFRAVGTTTGAPNEYAFGTVEATEPAGLAEGTYGIYLALAPGAMNAGGVSDLAADAGSYQIKLYTYVDGQAVDSVATVTAGSIKYDWKPQRQRLTINIDATFSDGTVLHSEYTGKPVDVSSVGAMVPAKRYSNEIEMINPAGTGSTSYPIESITVTKLTPSQWSSSKYTLRITFNAPTFGANSVKLEVIADEVVNKGNINMATVDNGCYAFYANTIQLHASNPNDSADAWKNHPKDGWLNVSQEGDVYKVHIEVTNYYTMNGSTGGTGEKIVLNWEGAAN